MCSNGCIFSLILRKKITKGRAKTFLYNCHPCKKGAKLNFIHLNHPYIDTHIHEQIYKHKMHTW